MKNTSFYHITWYIAIALAIVLAICHYSYWYVPIVVYLVVASASIVIIAALHDKVEKLPYCARKAFKMAIKK